MFTIKFTNKKLKKIVNVYQLNYKNKVATGLGEYLRGSFSLFQICKGIGIDFGMNIKNHPLSKYIFCVDESIIDYKNVSWYPDINLTSIQNETQSQKNTKFFDNFIEHINNVDCETYYIYCNSFPVLDIIGEFSKNYIKSFIKPNRSMQKYISFTLTSLKLIPKEYSVIHIRTGNKYLVKEEIIKISFSKKIEKIYEKEIIPNEKYLIITDNSIFKSHLKTTSNICVFKKPICHTGENANQTDEALMNTLLDFFFISNAKNVICISSSDSCSAFSEYGSIIYDVPYKNIKLEME